MTDFKSYWLGALLLSVCLHAALLIGVRPTNSNVAERAAGELITVSGSLASVLGQATNAVEVEAKQVEPTKVIEALPRETEKQEVQASTPRQVESAKAEEAITPPETELESENAIAALSETPQSEIEEIRPTTSKLLEPKRIEKSDASGAETKKRESQKQKRSRKRKVSKQRSPKKKQSKPSSRARAGQNRRGAAGASRGGQRGRGAASSSAVRGYGSRVRARILANRPGSVGRGTVVVSFGVSSSGGLRYARISRSSGNSAIDRAVLAAVRRSAPFPRPPAGASSRQLRFSIPFTFR